MAVRAAELQDLWEEERRSKKPVYSLKLNRYVRPEPKWGIITRTVNDTFPALKAGGREVSTNLLSLFLVKVLVLKKMCQRNVSLGLKEINEYTTVTRVR